MKRKYQDAFLSQENGSSAFNQLGKYTSIAKYARYDYKEGKRESFSKQVDRVMKMHKDKLTNDGVFTSSVEKKWRYAYKYFINKKVLGSQRALQFGGPSIINKNTRMYNCAASYVDRPRVFQETMYTLLCGSGVGFSVQKHHVNKLPGLISITPVVKKIYTPEDSIEGWADCIGVLMSSFFIGGGSFPQYENFDVVFDFSKIRPKGSPISDSNGKAPGPEPLRKALCNIKDVLKKALKNGKRLRPIDVYDIIAHMSDAVLAGGVRRSALICIFSHGDDEMMNAKTGSWYIDNPQRGRSNNSALLLRGSTSRAQFKKLFDTAKQFGEPGFIWADSTETLFNPCVEACLYGYNSKGDSGFQFCNLCEINMKNTTEHEFYKICKAAAILGTFQATYTDFGYLGKVTQEIVEHEALLGISMTGMMDNPEIAFNPHILQNGVAIIKKENYDLALELGINPSARLTCIKPAGTTSCILETSSGIHPAHAKRYFRRVQSNKDENPLKYFKSVNRPAVEESVWSANNTDDVITFLCKTPPGALTKKNVSAIKLLEKVKLVQENWVIPGSDANRSYQPYLRHNVSNTITIKPDEWGDVFEYIYSNRKYFTGVSLLASSGDMDYDQAPFQEVKLGDELYDEYGQASLFASGLIVHAHNAFDGNLYSACSAYLGTGENLDVVNFNGNDPTKVIRKAESLLSKKAWIARADKFTNNFFRSELDKPSTLHDKKRMTYCLKEVDAYHKWCKLIRSYKPTDWNNFYEESDTTKHEGSSACPGGFCEIKRF